MNYRDEDLLPISALQHLAFCERQCALIHVEREWEENERTAEGKVIHERVDEGYRAYRKGLKQFTSVQVRSRILGISGRLDMLELSQIGDGADNCTFLHLKGHWQLQPVEFKRGKPKKTDIDRVQVCAQALCLEEMTGSRIEQGSLFYAQLRRRTDVEIDDALRTRTLNLIRRLREIVAQSELPPPVLKRHCQSCSLIQICQPKVSSGKKTSAYRQELLG